MTPAIFNWSGGKDSSLALHYIQQHKEFELKFLLTSVNAVHQRISMHGVRRELLQKQANSIGIPLKELLVPEMPTMDEYNAMMRKTMGEFKDQGIDKAIFGDIFLEDLKKYRDERLAEAGFIGVYPLWKKDTKELVHEFIDLGFKTVVVCINSEKLDESFCGRIIDKDFIKDLPLNVDPAGENGEFHTFCFDGPIYKDPIQISWGEKVFKTYPNPVVGKEDAGFWFQDLF